MEARSQNYFIVPDDMNWLRPLAQEPYYIVRSAAALLTREQCTSWTEPAGTGMKLFGRDPTRRRPPPQPELSSRSFSSRYASAERVSAPVEAVTAPT